MKLVRPVSVSSPTQQKEIPMSRRPTQSDESKAKRAATRAVTIAANKAAEDAYLEAFHRNRLTLVEARLNSVLLELNVPVTKMARNWARLSVRRAGVCPGYMMPDYITVETVLAGGFKPDRFRAS